VRRALTIAALVAGLCAIASAARAQGPAPAPRQTRVRRTLVFLAGAATGLAVHESGHVVFGAAFGAHPRVRGIRFGPFPFFAIGHDPVSRGREFVISSAGLWLQNAGEEWLLSARPHLRDERAPWLKGLLAFDLATSAVYAIAAVGRFGPPERDTRGMAVSLGHHGAPEPLVGAVVLAPAVLDGYRYLRPDAVWAVWASRGAKVGLVLLALAAGR
jgi:hypothetical protein